jgi:hypothetical protein
MKACEEVFKREQAGKHFSIDCTKLEMPCTKCQMVIHMQEFSTHDCLRDMRAKIEKQENHINAIT